MFHRKPIIMLRDVWKSYHNEYILKEINLDVYEGDFICIRGKSGVGKSSLLRILSLLTIPSRGKICFMDRDITSSNDDVRSSIRARYYGVVFQGETLIPTLTSYENIMLGKYIKDIEEDKFLSIDELMHDLNIGYLKDKYPETLSAGEKQRIAIARALIGMPSILILDEPFANLDEENEANIIDILKQYNLEKRMSIILTTTELYSRLPCLQLYDLKKARLYRSNIFST